MAPLPDRQPDARPMLDCRRKDLPRFVEIAAGIEHALHSAFLGPLLDLVIIAVVSAWPPFITTVSAPPLSFSLANGARHCPSRSRPWMAPLSVTRALSQHKIFENEFSFATWKWRFALLASDVVIGGFRPGFCFDNLIQRFASRAEEQ